MQARHHYQAAADLGLRDAHLHLAICHLEGWGGPADRTAFLSELTVAAEAGYVPAQRILSAVYNYGFGVPASNTIALRWAERAATQDDPEGQAMVGSLVERGRNLMNDVKLARTWYQLAAETEYTSAMQRMARTFLSGDLSQRDFGLAVKWLTLAATSGDSTAKFNLALIESLHVDSPGADDERTRRLLVEAAQEGEFQASEVLALVAGGRTFRAAFQQMMRTTRAQRYVESAEAAYVEKLVDGSDHPPVIRRTVEPIYPLSLLMEDTEGKVLVEFIVAVDGRVAVARIRETNHPEFGERALEAVKQWRFHPAIKAGRAVPVKMAVPIVFNLTERIYGSIDGTMDYARRRAQVLGPPVLNDMLDPRHGRRVGLLPRPLMPDGQPIKPIADVLLALVLDATGKPKRGHVLRAKPEEAGSGFLTSALAGKFEPADGSELADNVTVVVALRIAPPAPAKKK